jgi:hypothetical protein
MLGIMRKDKLVEAAPVSNSMLFKYNILEKFKTTKMLAGISKK